MSIEYPQVARTLPLAVSQGRIRLRTTRVMLAMSITSLSLAVLSVLCTVFYLIYLAIITTDWSGELARIITDGGSYWLTPVQFTLADLLENPIFWLALAGSLLPFVLGAISVVFGIRYRLTAVIILSSLGIAFSALATAVILISSINTIT